MVHGQTPPAPAPTVKPWSMANGNGQSPMVMVNRPMVKHLPHPHQGYMIPVPCLQQRRWIRLLLSRLPPNSSAPLAARPRVSAQDACMLCFRGENRLPPALRPAPASRSTQGSGSSTLQHQPVNLPPLLLLSSWLGSRAARPFGRASSFRLGDQRCLAHWGSHGSCLSSLLNGWSEWSAWYVTRYY